MIATAALMPSSSLTPQTEDGANTAHRFYEAVNGVIATGDTARLHAIVAPHFEEQARMPGEEPGRRGLEAYLATLHDADATLRLVPEVVATAGDLAVVSVTVQREQGPAAFAGAVVDPPQPWGPVDVLRIADGTVAARWSQTDGTALVRPLARASLDLPAPAPRVVTVDRVTLEAASQWSSRATGPHLLYLEEGHLLVHLRQGRGGGAEPTPMDPVAPLSAGQSVAITAGTAFAMSSVGMGATRVVVVSWDVPQVPGGNLVHDALPPGVARQTLAGGMATDVGVGPTVVTLGQLILASGAQLSLSSAKGPILLAGDDGQFGMVATESAWIRSGRDGVSRHTQEARLAPGDGALLRAEGVTLIQNMGDAPVVVLGLALVGAGLSDPLPRCSTCSAAWPPSAAAASQRDHSSAGTPLERPPGHPAALDSSPPLPVLWLPPPPSPADQLYSPNGLTLWNRIHVPATAATPVPWHGEGRHPIDEEPISAVQETPASS